MDMHEGLKIRRGQPHGGSIPPPGTKISSVKRIEFKIKASQSREAFPASKDLSVLLGTVGGMEMLDA
jgi:hypothetical protein